MLADDVEERVKPRCGLVVMLDEERRQLRVECLADVAVEGLVAELQDRGNDVLAGDADGDVPARDRRWRCARYQRW